MIYQGDLYWTSLVVPLGSEPGFRRPGVVIQNNALNHSALRTVVVCLLTTNLRRAEARGNVLLQRGEAGLPAQSVVVVSQILTVDKRHLREKIGSVSDARIRQILDGIRLITEPSPD